MTEKSLGKVAELAEKSFEKVEMLSGRV